MDGEDYPDKRYRLKRTTASERTCSSIARTIAERNSRQNVQSSPKKAVKPRKINEPVACPSSEKQNLCIAESQTLPDQKIKLRFQFHHDRLVSSTFITFRPNGLTASSQQSVPSKRAVVQIQSVAQVPKNTLSNQLSLTFGEFDMGSATEISKVANNSARGKPSRRCHIETDQGGTKRKRKRGHFNSLQTSSSALPENQPVTGDQMECVSKRKLLMYQNPMDETSTLNAVKQKRAFRKANMKSSDLVSSSSSNDCLVVKKGDSNTSRRSNDCLVVKKRDSNTSLNTEIATLKSSQIKYRDSNSDHPVNHIQSQGSAELYSTSDVLQAANLPLVWSSSRQELCESAGFFRSYQGGVYSIGNVARGWLIDGTVAQRDYFDGTVLITHGGGRTDAATGILKANQTPNDKGIKALMASCDKKQPVVLIVGPKYPGNWGFPLGQYTVLEKFIITHYWPEKDDHGCIRYKFRAQKLLEDSRIHIGSLSEISTSQCCVCQCDSLHIYEHWMCLNINCTAFWKTTSKDDNRPEPSSNCLSYTSAFLAPVLLKDIISDIDVIQFLVEFNGVPDRAIDGGVLSSKQGFWCAKCHKVTRREYLHHISCKHCSPNKKIRISLPVVCLNKLFAEPHILQNIKMKSGYPQLQLGCYHFAKSQVIKKANVSIIDSGRLAGMLKTTYYLENGCIEHILGERHYSMSSKAESPDMFTTEAKHSQCSGKTFEDLQSENVVFKREGHINHRVEKNFMNNYFSFNIGEAYRHSVNQDSFPIEKCPPQVQTGFQYLQEISAVSFNEALLVAYKNGNKMDFHDDGEDDVLGPVVTWSLGLDATMYFCEKINTKKENSKAKVEVAGASQGCSGQMGNFDDNHTETDIQKEQFPKKVKPTRASALLSLHLRHGDLIIMHGKQVQQHLLHAVDPEGVRFAFTGRIIRTPEIEHGTYQFNLPHEMPNSIPLVPTGCIQRRNPKASIFVKLSEISKTDEERLKVIQEDDFNCAIKRCLLSKLKRTSLEERG
ncbi:hypothetical protein BJ742DRAFT_796482 [Cladochytrium replicatum]|nr:hypothetical protein BJ742DRAFT_796482 [Cladochytrium replicatum]